jgi:hypothetical protein
MDIVEQEIPTSNVGQLMRQLLIFIAPILILSSCAHYSTLYAERQADSKLAIQGYYSPCCGWCGQRVITDNLKNEQTSLLINCRTEDMYSRLCTEWQIGTQKHVDVYKRNRVIQHAVYRPVYDTTRLKQLYPNIDRETYFDTLMISRQMIPLTRLDSMLIERALAFQGDSSCNKDHLRLILGYVFVRNDKIKGKKEKDFKSPGK